MSTSVDKLELEKKVNRVHQKDIREGAKAFVRAFAWFVQCPQEIMGAINEKYPEKMPKVGAAFNAAKACYDNLVKYSGYAKIVAKEVGQ